MSVNIELVTHSYRGYEYFYRKNPVIGNINGYVIIKKGQKGFDVPYSFDDSTIECHGGITYDTNKYGALTGVNLDPKDYRIVGFDTLHPGDYNPAMEKQRKQMAKENPVMNQMSDIMKPHHWTKPELGKQCRLIIDQLVKGNYDAEI